MSGGDLKTVTLGAEGDAVVKASHYRFEHSDRLILAKLEVGGSESSKPPSFALNFLKTQIVPTGTNKKMEFVSEQCLLATMVFTEEQAKRLLKSLNSQLGTGQD